MVKTLLVLLWLPSAAAYTLHATPPQPHRIRTARCVIAAEKPFEGGGGGPAFSARALDQLITADPEKKKSWKGFKRGKKASERQTEQKKASSGKGFGVATEQKRFDRRPADGAPCACGSSQPYERCCKPCHEANLATDPLELIRARYTAYAYRLPDFLIETTSPNHDEWQADRAAWKRDLLGFCDNFVCDGLEVGELSEQHVAGDDSACVQVPFRASLVQKGAIKMLDLIETSTLVQAEGGGWLYAYCCDCGAGANCCCACGGGCVGCVGGCA